MDHCSMWIKIDAPTWIKVDPWKISLASIKPLNKSLK